MKITSNVLFAKIVRKLIYGIEENAWANTATVMFCLRCIFVALLVCSCFWLIAFLPLAEQQQEKGESTGRKETESKRGI